jgi:hypothetical protein
VIRRKTNAYVRDVCFDDNGSDSRCDGNGVEGHGSNPFSIGSFAVDDIELPGADLGRQCNKF